MFIDRGFEVVLGVTEGRPIGDRKTCRKLHGIAKARGAFTDGDLISCFGCAKSAGEQREVSA